jgi:hypothetical protein
MICTKTTTAFLFCTFVYFNAFAQKPESNNLQQEKENKQISLTTTENANANTIDNNEKKSIETKSSSLLFGEQNSILQKNIFVEKSDKKVKTFSRRVGQNSYVVTEDTAHVASVPFAYGDFSWLNGNNRQSAALMDGPIFTPDFTVDVNYTRSNTNPIDNTVLGSTALSRNNEFTVSFVGIGGDFHYQNVRGRIMTQFGTRATVVPRNDYSGYRGQYDLPDAYRYLSEA